MSSRPSRRAGAPTTARLGPRALALPLSIVLTLTTALALVVTALTLVPRPLPPVPASVAALPAASAPPGAAVLSPPDPTVLLARPPAIALPPAPLVLALARLTYQPGVNGVLRALPGPLLLVVDAGALAVRFAGVGRLHRTTDIDAATDGDCRGACELRVGDSLLLPAATAASLASLAGAPASVLAATVVPAAAVTAGIGRIGAARGAAADPPRWNPAWAVGGNVTPLVGGWAMDLDAPAATLALTRISLAPDAQTTLPPTGLHALAVETGALTLTAADGVVWLQHPEDRDDWLESGRSAMLLSGDGALLQEGARAQVRNAGAGPLQLLVVSVAQAAAA